ncbi:MAG TPA: MHYT domain-containing protein [Caulobacteraceae bacterium]
MFTVLNCIRQEHDLRFVALAALICLVAAVSAFGFFRHARRAPHAWAAWTGLAGFVGGSGVWATHFIAMLAYEPSLNIHYELAPTLASWVIAVIGTAAGFALALRPAPGWRGPAIRGVGGLVVGLSVAAMHFIGMAAVRLQGELLWSPGFVVASIVIGAVGAAAALAADDGRPGLVRRAAPPLLLLLAIVGLHFTAMAATTMLPSNVAPLGASLIDRGPLAVVTAVLTLLIFVAAGGLIWMERFAKGAAFRSVRASLDALPSGIAFFDAAEQLLVWNGAFAALLGPAGQGLAAGHELAWALADADRAGALPAMPDGARGIRTELARAAQAAAVREGRLADGRWMRLEARLTPDGGKVVILTDTTEANAHAETLAKARDDAEAANRAKSEFLANMSHEIRTPLNGVLGIAEVLAGTELNERQAGMLEVIRESGVALEALLGDILDLARVESGEVRLNPAPVAVADACAAVAALFADRAAAKGLTLHVRIDPSAQVTVLADPLRLRQILTNLVSNAVKFTDAGAVTLAAARAPDGRLRLEVADTGIGFDPALKESLFQRFRQADGSATRNHGGVGLGLPLCRRLAELMGGTLDCETAPGCGSSFWLEADFPLADLPGAAGPADAGEDHAPRVLVVDDNPVNRRVLELILESAGLEHAAAGNGAEALQAAQGGDFDAILMDIQMPVMDGLEATRRIRQWETDSGRTPRPIYIVSANCLPEHVAAGEAAGADGHIAKPVSAAKVLGALAGEAQAA